MDYINQLNRNLNSIENALQSEPSSLNPALVTRFTEILSGYRNDLESHQDLRENHIEEYDALSDKILELSTRVGQLGSSIVRRDEGLDLPSLEESHAPRSARREEEEGPSWFQDEHYVPVAIPSLEGSQAPSPAGREEEVQSVESFLKAFKDELKAIREDLKSLDKRINMYFPYLEAEEINKENPMTEPLMGGLNQEHQYLKTVDERLKKLNKEATKLGVLISDEPTLGKNVENLENVITELFKNIHILYEKAEKKGLITEKPRVVEDQRDR